MQPGSLVRLPSTQLYAIDSGVGALPHVMIHGLGASHTSWLDIAPGLSERHRTITVDLPGYGFSPPIARHDVGSLCDVMIELLEELGMPARLIGNSMGGLISEMIASRRPDLVADLVLLTPASPAPVGTRPPRPAVTARLAAQSLPALGPLVVGIYQRTSSAEERVDGLLELVCADPTVVSESTRAASLEMARRRESMPWSVRALAESTESIRKLYLGRSKFEDMISAIRAEALVLSGARDVLVPPAAIEALHDLRPDWTFEARPDLGHVPQLEDPTWTLDRIEAWVTEHERTVPADRPG